MRFNVYYTDRAQPDSSFVNRAWYDKNSRDLTVELHGVLYLYRNVPEYVYKNLVAVESPGNYYRQSVQGTYRGVRLGAVQDAIEVSKATGSVEIKNLTTTTGPSVFNNNDFGVRLSGTSRPAVATETPKLSLSKDVKVTTESAKHPYELTFVLEDDESKTERKHVLSANNEDDALDQLFSLGELLDQDILPVALTVRYN